MAGYGEALYETDDEDTGIRELSSAYLSLSGSNYDAALNSIRKVGHKTHAPHDAQEMETSAGSRSASHRSLANVLANANVAPPSWRTNPMVQVCIMGLIFMFVFISFSTIQALAGSQRNNKHIAGCFFAPAITTRLGCKTTMFFGICGYAALVITGLIYFEGHEAKSDECCSGLQWVVISGGALLGFGASILWTAQGRMILEYTNDANRGFLFGVFWAFFQAAALVGGVLALVYFNQMGESGDLTPLYFVFLGCILLGGAGIFVLQEPEAIADSASPRGAGQVQAEPVNPLVDLVATVKMFFTYRMACLSLLFFYTGFNQIIGGLVFGMVLDNAQPAERRKRAMLSLLVLSVVTLSGAAFAYPLEHKHRDASRYPKYQPDTEISPFGSGFWGPTAAMALWGLSDAMAQTYAYWLIGNLYEDGQEKARAVGFYKMTQSLGWAAGFALMPVDRVVPLSQLFMTAGTFVAGALLSLLQLPAQGPLNMKAIKDEDP